VELRVHNLGEPIPVAIRPMLFAAFKRGKTQVSGMGLGLYIVRHVVQAHGGSVDVESTREAGTTFVVRLPRWTPNPNG
jgi:signal transduction histidine kinase